MSQPTNLCYYSNKCQWSKAFISELAQTQWKNSFKFICVDPVPGRPALPGWLKKVPTIVVAGEGEPRTDSDVMNWLYEKRVKDAPQGQPGAPAGAPGAAEPSAFSMMEQVSFAKGFSYSGIDADTSSAGDGGMTMPGAFTFLHGGAAEGGSQQQGKPTIEDVKGKSKKEQMFDKQMEAYQRDRDLGMPKLGGRI
jgi:hypothetical protein